MMTSRLSTSLPYMWYQKLKEQLYPAYIPVVKGWLRIYVATFVRPRNLCDISILFEIDFTKTEFVSFTI